MSSLAFLPAGNAKLTRRASKYSSVRAVVVRKRGKFIERCGILVESRAIGRACEECAVTTPAAAFKPIAGTPTILAPHARFGPIGPAVVERSVLPKKKKSPRNAASPRHADKRAPTKVAPKAIGKNRRKAKPAKSPNAPAIRHVSDNSSPESRVTRISALIRQAYPNCSASRAQKVAEYSVEQPETRDFLAYSPSPDDVGILVSKYLRRGRTGRHI